MMGDYHVRFCERFGVKFPLPTRQKNEERNNYSHIIDRNIILC